jgi:hypothetical protein
MSDYINKLFVNSTIEKKTYRSVILTLQESLFRDLDPNIITNLSEDGHILYASNITEQNIKYVQFVANSPLFGGVYMVLEGVEVFLDNNLLPTPVYGLYEILNQRVKIVDAKSYIINQKTYTPFNVNFQVGTVPQLTDTLSSLSTSSTNTYGHIKKYTLIFSNHTPAPQPAPQPAINILEA